MLELAEIIEILVRLNQLELAEKYGQWYLEIEQRIKFFDYSSLDKHYEDIRTTP